MSHQSCHWKRCLGEVAEHAGKPEFDQVVSEVLEIGRLYRVFPAIRPQQSNILT